MGKSTPSWTFPYSWATGVLLCEQLLKKQ